MVDENTPADTPPEEPLPPTAPVVKVPPIESRFLFVDIAALRAKQLRRGARPRVQTAEGPGSDHPRKPERVAMEEVREGLVEYHLPDPAAVPAPEES